MHTRIPFITSFIFKKKSIFNYCCLIFFFLISIQQTYSQCAVEVEPGSLKLIDNGGCMYSIAVSTQKTGGNPSAQVLWGCGPNGTVATNEIMCLGGWSSNNVYKTDISPLFECDCMSPAVNVYVSIVTRTSSNCGGSSCNAQNTINLAISLSDFNAKVVDNKVCLSWHVESPDPFNRYIIEKSKDGKNFEAYTQLNHTESYYANNDFKYCFKSVGGYSYFRLKVVEQDGSVTMAPIRRIQPNNVSLAIATIPGQNTITIFGLNYQEDINYTIFNNVGTLMQSGRLNSDRINLVNSIKSGMYVLHLTLPNQTISKWWVN